MILALVGVRASKLFDACPWWLREKIAPGSGGFMGALDIYVRCSRIIRNRL
ncbi:hypothetical protein CORMATOL_02342 [Corynebacterium matruchotii ATCC 33806]|uniref:Uncharacterized protein n=1 Tax=Corynebacterium matruchotii ATCC 33806 TaxID=566549 RepID=C0E5R0_9CORY|nr:hypothetical protein CORMATOL_02342 [Corynebacterium matruchotii ATCC 33806]